MFRGMLSEPTLIRYRSTSANGSSYFKDHRPQCSKKLCEQCDLKIGDFYCNVCDTSYCLKCWDVVSAHRKNKLGPGGVPHEKTDHAVAEKIRALLEPSRNSFEQEEMHKEDESTTWFGVARDEADDCIFKDYGRYASLMAETPGDWRKGDQQTRFPSLISFVGETGELIHMPLSLIMHTQDDNLSTGAGKSTLIKGLVDVNS